MWPYSLLKSNLGELNIGVMSHLVIHVRAENTQAKNISLVNFFAIRRAEVAFLVPDCYVWKAALVD